MKTTYKRTWQWGWTGLVLMVIIASSGVVLAQEEPEEPQGEIIIQAAGEGRFNFSVRDTALPLVLRQINTQVRKNIVTTSAANAGRVTVDLYGVTFQEALDAVLHSSGRMAVEKEDIIYVYTKEEYQELIKSQMRLETRVFRLDYLKASDASALIASELSADGKITITPESQVGIQTQDAEDWDTGGNAYADREVLVVRDYEPNLESIARVLETLDVRPDQILIESTIMSARLNEENQLGVDWQVFGGMGAANEYPTSDLNGIQGDRSTSNWTATQAQVGTTFAAGLPTGADTADQFGAFRFGIIANNVAAFIKAVESVSDVNFIANPKLLVLNKQQGHILIGQRLGYVDITSQTPDSTVSAIQFLETGVTLVVRPFIAKDGFIRLELQPKDSSGEIVGGLPNETTTQVTTNMLVKDGQTVIIGGLFRDNTSRTRAQIPVLGEVPVAGVLARGSQDNITREEVIILITPHVIQHPEDDELNEQMKQMAHRIALGARQGLVWWTRTRLGDSYMMAARRAMAQGDHDKALWYTNLCLSLDPQRNEALVLKNQLVPKASWAKKPRLVNVHDIVELMILNDKQSVGTMQPAPVGGDSEEPPAMAPAQRDAPPSNQGEANLSDALPDDAGQME